MPGEKIRDEAGTEIDADELRAAALLLADLCGRCIYDRTDGLAMEAWEARAAVYRLLGIRKS